MLLVAFVAGCSKAAPPVETTPQASAEPETPSAAASVVREASDLRIDNAMVGWLDSGLTVAAGDSVALFAKGTLEAEGLTFEPRHLLWYRIGESGSAVQFRADQEVFSAAGDGRLYITLRPLGVYWTDRVGSYPSGFTQLPAVPADITVDSFILEGSVEEGLTRMAQEGYQAAALAQATAAKFKTLPQGFDHLWYVTRANVWSDGTVDGRPGIAASTTDDASIVKMPLDIALNENTVFEFSWRYDSIPAQGPETQAQFHDYLSVALEFDNGQDLTWFWSRELPVGTHFECPLPGWGGKEYHWILQSGDEGLGEWFSYQRPVLADFRTAIGGEEPKRIVGIWFIANSLFGRQSAAASFADAVVINGEERTTIFGRD
jgi:hypothetical protein